ncbi:MAG TPA: hypothetical protein VJT73_07735 [Polyangiaceae bacterium]|nr:hypothetical protein [Polyangiaceae bacterium]
MSRGSRPPLSRLHPAFVLCAYAEELASGARVAVFGDATVGLAEELLDRGARLVHVYDTDAARIAEATARGHDRSVFYSRLPASGDLGVRDGAFDLVIVVDLARAEDASALLAMARRVLSTAGAALLASPNSEKRRPLWESEQSPSALGYYELYEAVAAHFASVRMIGQTPFVGYAVTEFSAQDPEPTIDTSLAEGGKEPDFFVVLASERSVQLEAFALIEVPLGSAESDEHLERIASEADFSLAEAGDPGTGTVLVNILEAEREAALDSLRQQEQLVKDERVRGDHALRELAAAREELALLRERCATLQRSLEDEEGRRSAIETEIEKVRHDPALAQLRERVRHLDAALERSDKEKSIALESVENRGVALRRAEEKAALAKQTAEQQQASLLKSAEEKQAALLKSVEEKQAALLRSVEEKHAALLRSVEAKQAAAINSAIEEQAADLERLEAQLRERGQEVAGLRAEVDRRALLVKELLATRIVPDGEVAQVSNGHDGAIADLSAQLDRLAGDAARREADLVAARWKIAQLERDLTAQR